MAKVLSVGDEFGHGFAVLRRMSGQHVPKSVWTKGMQASRLESGVDDLAHRLSRFPMRACEPTSCKPRVGLSRQGSGRKQRIVGTVGRHLVEKGHPAAQWRFGLSEVLGEERVDSLAELGGHLAWVLSDGFCPNPDA